MQPAARARPTPDGRWPAGYGPRGRAEAGASVERSPGWRADCGCGGGAGPDSSPFEKVYVSLVGSVSVVVDGFVLNPMDSWTVAPNEVREIVNHQNHLATTLVVMPYPPA